MQQRIQTICRVLAFILLFGCWSGCGAARQSPLARQANAEVATHRQTSTISLPADFHRFAGTWTAHGAQLSVSPHGMATFTARTYRWCAAGVAHPCDTMNAQGQIADGAREHLQFVRINGSRAYGNILNSTVRAAGLAVSLTLEPNDSLLYMAQTPIVLLCGPNAPAGTCGA